MFNSLSEKLDKALHVLKGHGSITEVNVAETLKEVRRALLDADVNFKISDATFVFDHVILRNFTFHTNSSHTLKIYISQHACHRN